MEPRRPKHKQAPPLIVAQEELEKALLNPRSYHVAPPPPSANENEATTATNVAMDVLFGSNQSIEVIHTHMSMVFRLPERVYKVKKPVNFGFADFSTLYKRFQACMAEVQLNQRLAPNIYMGVVPISMQRETREITIRCDDFWTLEKNGNLDWWLNDAFGEIVEWAVHMVRLPDEQTLEYRINKQQEQLYQEKDEQQEWLDAEIIDQVAQRIASFHHDARRGPRIDPFGKEDVIRRNVDENFEQTKHHVGVTVDEAVYERIKTYTYAQLSELAALIETRVTEGFTCDSHGDLRLEHIYMMDDPDNTSFVVLDCIEFNEQFRYGDPLSDAAFLMMDLWRHGRHDLARVFQDKYLTYSHQNKSPNARLFRFYAAYRAVVRAKVCGFRVLDTTLSKAQRDKETQRARCYWLVALTLLSPPRDRPCLIMIAGLPASGKSNLARMMAEEDARVHWLRADAIRKELFQPEEDHLQDQAPAPVPVPVPVPVSSSVRSSGGRRQQPHATPASVPKPKPTGSFEEGLYAPSVTQRTYEEIRLRCVNALQQGGRVLVDATFRDPTLRHKFLQTAIDEGACCGFIICDCDREIIRGRMLARKDDMSDATWEVFEAMETQWKWHEIETSTMAAHIAVINTEKEKELTLRRANMFLRKLELL